MTSFYNINRYINFNKRDFSSQEKWNLGQTVIILQKASKIAIIFKIVTINIYYIDEDRL